MGACFSHPVQDVSLDGYASKDRSEDVPPVTDVREDAAINSYNGSDVFDKKAAMRQRQMAKRIAVAAEAISSASSVDIPKIPKTSVARSLIENAMRGNLLFEGLSLGARQAIVNSMTSRQVGPGEVIIEQGDSDASRYYAIEKGTFDVFVREDSADCKEDGLVATCGPGEGFGELALLYAAPRAATVKATTPGKIWIMERYIYHSIKQCHIESLNKRRQEVMNALPMLSALAPEHKCAVAEALLFMEFKDGDVICREGEDGNEFFMLHEGTVHVKVGGKLVTSLSEGDYFGERALLKSEPRAATIIAEGYVACFSLSRQAFNDLLGPIGDLWRYETLRKVPILANLSEPQLLELARCMDSFKFRKGEIVFRKGDDGDRFYVVEEGEFIVSDGKGTELARCCKGQCFGELALIRKQPRAATVTACFDSTAISCSKDEFDKHIGKLNDIRILWRFEALRKVPLLSALTQEQKFELAGALKPINFAAGEVVVRKGDQGDSFYIIEQGECAVIEEDGKEIGLLGPAGYFGERALLRGEPRVATITAKTDIRLLVLRQADFKRLLGSVLKSLQEKSAIYDATLHKHKLSGNLKLDDFQELSELGEGAFGSVSLVRYNGRHYALKSLSKGRIVSAGLAMHVKREKEVQAYLSSPFLVSLLGSFQDHARLYMVLEIVHGGEFFAYLRKRGEALSEDSARFYAACVILGLEYMHDRDIAWRCVLCRSLRLLDSKKDLCGVCAKCFSETSDCK